MKIAQFALILLVLGSTGCALVSPSSAPVQYSEDLRLYRPLVQSDTLETQIDEINPPDADPVYHENELIDNKLSALNRHQRRTGTTPGYTIQVYSGTSREEASSAKAKVYRILPEARPETKYEQPIYKVRVGEFGDRLEAQATYAELQQEFPQAAVIPFRIKIN